MSLLEPRVAAPGVTDPERASRILDAMERRAGGVGIRAIVMADLARELGISTKTLYREFATKDALVVALVERWAERLLDDEEVADDTLIPAERVRVTVHRMVRFRAKFCDEFWDDLHADHPAAWNRFVELFDEVQRRAATWVARSVRPGVDPAFARAMLRAGVQAAMAPEVRSGGGLSVDEAVDAAVDLWVYGALAPAAHSKSSP